MFSNSNSYRPYSTYSADENGWGTEEEPSSPSEAASIVPIHDEQQYHFPSSTSADSHDNQSVGVELEEYVRPPIPQSEPFSLYHDETPVVINPSSNESVVSSAPTPPQPSKLRPFIILFFPLFFTFTFILAFVTSSMHLDACHTQLRLYLILTCITSLCYFGMSIIIGRNFPAEVSSFAIMNRAETMKWVYIVLLKQVIGIADFSIFLYGNYWLFIGHPSPADNQICEVPSVIYRVALLMITMGYVGIVIPLVVFAYVAYKYPDYIFVIRRGQDDNKYKPASAKAISQLPTLTYADGNFASSDATCAICLSAYEPGNVLRTLPCDHHFHMPCCDTWLEKQNSCPMCRKSLEQSTADKKNGSRSSRRVLDESNTAALLENQVDTQLV
jgi:hypothetical protein